MSVVSFPQALETVRTHAATLAAPPSERVPLLASLARVLAEDLTADRDQPPFDRATRDGFAVRAADWNTGQRVRVAGQVRAGELWSGGEIPAGCAVEIMTGAPVPPGLDAVAMIEHAETTAHAAGAAPGHRLQPGENIVPRGAEARAGAPVLPSGTELGAAEIAVAAVCGRAELTVRTRPLVAIAATGDELVELTQTPAPHQIRNSNSYGLAALAELAGGRPVRLEIARDLRQDVSERIAQGRQSNLLLLSGGVSAGKYDLVEEVLAEFGAEFFFTGVQMQPGRPLVFGRLPARQQQPPCYFFGLPGNPVSTEVTFHCFVAPFLQAMRGAPWTGPRFAQATLMEEVAARSGLTRILPARLNPALDRTAVRLIPWQGSGDLAANARANAYAVLPDARALHSGDIITVLLR